MPTTPLFCHGTWDNILQTTLNYCYANKFCEKAELQSVSIFFKFVDLCLLLYLLWYLYLLFMLNSLFKCLTPSGDGFHCLRKNTWQSSFNSLSSAKNQGKIDDFHIFINISAGIYNSTAGIYSSVFQASSHFFGRLGSNTTHMERR